MDSEEKATKFYQLLADVPLPYIELSDKIIAEAEKLLNVSFNSMLHVSLSDHLRYALDRHRENIPFPNELLWEIKRFYPKEYQAAKSISKIINYYEKVWLSEDELGFIALHFVNAQGDFPEMAVTVQITELIQTIMTIIQVNFKIEIDETTLSYSRFVTHISYFVRRIMQGEILESGDSFIFKQLVEKFPKTYHCVKQIAQYLKINSDILLTEEEMIYFIIHINRVVSHSEQSK
ncbi:PRD domain-containing protein [Enterococcus saccharolyticus]|uniref:PRD domain-containing protein n=1 Tax=Enterococcus TaxID=1350 RepID=UPI001E282528|nr:PRD domain-containing protein [Enterococcus saccharolyticus]MCD5003072.1 PRD domain-containing protein [Enterococcus saccharolyticus]